jgi:phosphatidylglycerophosphate synthase
MTVISALVFAGSAAVRIGGMTLSERAIRLAHRSGFSPIRLWGDGGLTAVDVDRLRSEGVPIDRQPHGSLALEAVRENAGVVIVGPDTLFGPTALTGLANAAQSGATAAAVYEAGAPRLLFASPLAGIAASAGGSIEAIAAAVAAKGRVDDVTGRDIFCRRIDRSTEIATVEREYIRHLNGRGESYFTKKIRRFSVPLSRQLVLLGATPTQVTMGGLVLAAASAWCIAQGSYAFGLLGALLYYASMVFDCSDGEVARLTLTDSGSGAWLETIVDYVTYFFLLAALVTAVRGRPGAEPYLVAATAALAASLIVVGVAGYLRYRVAAADPSQFDEASARVMADAPALERFARWGRQWIKRSSIAHLVVALALVGQLPVLLYLWAFGATVAAVVIVAVKPFVVRRVSVKPATLGQGGAAR